MPTTTDASIKSAMAEALFEETREPDQPSPWAHARYLDAMRTEFTPEERHRLRVLMHMEPYDADHN